VYASYRDEVRAYREGVWVVQGRGRVCEYVYDVRGCKRSLSEAGWYM
jgi:hypothetical protein